VLDPDGEAEEIGSLLQEVTEREAVNHVEQALIQECMGDSSQSSYPTIKQPFLIEDYDGSMIDARPLLAALNKNIHKCDSS